MIEKVVIRDNSKSPIYYLSEQEAEKYIASLGAFGYDTTALMNEYKQKGKITL